MKKGLTITLSVLAILAVLFAIFIIINKNISEDSTGITMTIKEGTLTRRSATIVLESRSDYSCGESYGIDKKENSEWKSIPPINRYTFNLLGLIPGKDGKIECNVDWSERYGELENGEYRIKKTVSTSDGEIELYAEFTIE